MKKETLYSLVLIIFFTLTACEKNETKVWYYDEPPLPAYITTLSSKSYDKGVEDGKIYFKLRGDKPINFEYTDGTNTFRVENVMEETVEVNVQPESTSKYWPTYVENTLGQGEVGQDTVTVSVYETTTHDVVIDGYLYRSKNKFFTGTSSEILELKETGDSWTRQVYLYFDLSGVSISENENIFLSCTILGTDPEKDVNGLFKLAAKQGTIDTTMTWDTKPADGLFSSVNNFPFSYSKNSVKTLDIDITEYFMSMTQQGINDFTMHLADDSGKILFNLASSSYSDELLRPQIKIRGLK